MSRPFDEFGKDFGDWWEAMSSAISRAVAGDDVLRDTPEQRRRDEEADELARRMEEEVSRAQPPGAMPQS